MWNTSVVLEHVQIKIRACNGVNMTQYKLLTETILDIVEIVS